MENEELVNQFKVVTGVDDNRAKFYLQAANWELNTALSSYYEDGTSDNPIDVSPEPPVEVEQNAQQQQQQTTAATDKNKPKGETNRFGTLGTLAQSSSSSEEEGEAFYAGGSERSGQQVLGPPKGKKKDIVADMFKSAKEHGAEVVDPQRAGNSRGNSSFGGAGYVLGADPTDPSQVVGQPSSSKAKSTGPQEITLKLWKNGFSVNDEQVRDYTDPNNKAFLDSVKEGVIPRELLDMAKGNEVQLNMEDHRHEDFIQPKKAIKAFSGQGHLLGNIVPPVIGSTGTTPTESDRIANEKKAQESVALKEGEAVTSIQIRLDDSTRLVGRFNHTHTVADVRLFITNARPQYTLRTFALRTAFPPQELTDDKKTLKEANLLNAAIIQRLT